MNKVLLSYNSLKNRWKSETPKLYKKVRNGAVVVSFLCPIAGNINGAPEWFSKSYWYIMSSSAVVAATSQLTKKTDKDGNEIIDVERKENG
jgi:hypothetical protein